MTKATNTRKPDIAAAITMPTGAQRELMDYVGGKIPFGTLQLDFANGKQIVVDTLQLCPDVIGAALMHGLKQKLVDAAAISRDPSNGRAANAETKYNAVNEVFLRLSVDCEWNKKREGAATGGLLKRALIELYEGRKTAEAIQTFLDGKTDKEKAALRKNPKVATIIERLRAEDGGEGTTDDLLAELEEMEEARDEAAGVKDESAE